MATNSWPAQRLEKLKQLAAAGYSSKIMAELLGVTKNAIIGMARRNGIPLLAKRKGAPTKKRKPKPKPEPLIKVPVVRPKIWEARRGQCRWPMWDMGEKIENKLYCGQPIEAGSSYCEEHTYAACRHEVYSRREPRRPFIALRLPAK
jgi:hypothetical protein